MSSELLETYFDCGVLPQGLLNPFLEKSHVQGLQGVGLIGPIADSVNNFLKGRTLKDRSRLL